jgi:hypothetical protein
MPSQQRVEVVLNLTGTPEPGQELATAFFSDARFPERFSIALHMLTPDEAGGGAPYVLNDSAGSDPQYAWTYNQALDRFLSAVAWEVEQLREGEVDRFGSTRDHWLEVAERVRARVYGDDPDPARRARDRQAIRDFTVDGEPLTLDTLQPYVDDWLAHARETGYDRRRNLSVAGEEK